MKIGLTGTHGIGKTSLAYALVGELKSRGIKAGMIREFVRECPLPAGTEENNSAEAQAWILARQVAEEIEAASRFDVVVCDRTVIDNYAYFIWAKEKFGCKPEIENFCKAIFENWSKTYDFIFKLEPAFNPQNDGFRSISPDWQMEIDRLVEKNISSLGISAHRLELKANRERSDDVLKVVKI